MVISTHDGQIYEDAVDYHLDRPSTSLGSSPVSLNQKELSNYPTTEDTDKKLYFVRHGDTDLNVESGEHSDDQPVRGWSQVSLNEDGRAHAQKAASSLKGLPIEHIVSSDLPRAAQTARIIGRKLDLPIEFDKGLRTWDLGDFTEKAGKDVHDQVAHYCKDAQDERPPGSTESFNEFSHRILSTVSDITQRHADKEILLVSHNSPERVINSWMEAGSPRKNDANQPVDLNKNKTPLINPSKELRQPNFGEGRMFGPMIDYINKEYERLGIKPGDHFRMPDSRGEEIEYERLRPEDEGDWNFMKVPEQPQKEIM